MRRFRALLLGVTLLGGAAVQAAGVDPDELLPIEDAFRLSAVAPARDRVEIRFDVADGYYLYRHRMGASAEGFDSGEAIWPAGIAHVDEFFGEVETYRQQVTGVLEGQAAPGTQRLQLKVRYQGCADLGVCYPPDTRTITVDLPAASALTAAPAPGGGDGLAALGRALQGSAAGGGAIGTGVDGSAQPLPLPEEQAFGFEAIVGDGDTILMRFTPARGYYLYRDRSSFSIEGAAGIAAGQPDWPGGVDHNDPYFGDTVVYFDQIDVPLPLRRSHPDAATVTLTATFQGCQDEGICYPPMTRSVQVAMPAGTVTSSATAAEMAPPTPTPAPTQHPDPAATPADPFSDARPEAAAAPPPASSATPVAAEGAAADNAVRSTAPPLPRGGLLSALALGLLGGLILNLMPCVLPILSLKVVGLAQSGGSRATARSHALWYTLGVLSAFAAIGALVLALRSAGAALGWGFQLQQPWFVALLVYLMFAVGLSLSGVFSIGGGLGNAGQQLAAKGGRTGNFFTGVLACVVASPCIAPFMGGALAFAFTASAPVAMTVFLALGLGLALPFLLIGFVPALASRLPKPGPWMETLQRFMAFPMYLTAIWLAWVLGRQHGVDAMALVAAGLVLLALGLWWYERKRWSGSIGGRVFAVAVLLMALVPVIAVARLQPAATSVQDSAGTAAWSAERLAALRAEGRPVFVNMTADWCVTCKANEQRVLAREPFRTALADTGAAYLVGDWTNVDSAISEFLQEHNAVGVPLYVVYPADGGPGEVLPALLSDDIAIGALQRAAR
ncbi:protein-disulfide reductase DsbD family protein [Luteimonas qiangzhengi]|uniref:protein-disulfide reductase DsbD family protein n=1 Tax=Luteimonas sp. MJ146 TaxID=3129240 RepID=UPI0031B9F1FE